MASSQLKVALHMLKKQIPSLAPMDHNAIKPTGEKAHIVTTNPL
jgi:hypothetical protein